MYALVVMTFDGSYIIEKKDFETIEDAWEHNDDMGSRWFFYPFPFVTTNSGITIRDTPVEYCFLIGKRLSTAMKLFKQASELPETQGLDPEEFLGYLGCPNMLPEEE